VLKRAIATILSVATTNAACAYSFTNYPSATVPPPVKIEVVEGKWECPNCTKNEKIVLEELQKRTNIKDKNALAAIMGNIKQESGFKANICEGGARVPYHQCYSGGYGLIQWTTENRYRGLGSFCKKYECDPSTIKGQVRYMINENQFQKILPEFENPGFSIDQYMVPSYYWLGWGIKGARERYAKRYARKLVWSLDLPKET